MNLYLIYDIPPSYPWFDHCKKIITWSDGRSHCSFSDGPFGNKIKYERELEIKHLLQEEKIDVIFLTETDVLLQSDNEYQIEGFKTVLPIKSNHEDKTRIICLIKNEWMSKCTIRNELMTSDFASIWIEIKTSNLRSSIIGGYYREWTVAKWFN